MAEVLLIDALTMAMAWELEHDPSVVILGEDVDINGGVFRATAGLQDRFGEDRVPIDCNTMPACGGRRHGISAPQRKTLCRINQWGRRHF